LREGAETPEKAPTRGSRLLVLAAMPVVALIAFGVYLAVGRPGFPDQPYKQRLESWREMVTPQGIQGLQPAQVAALLRERARETPNDAALLRFLAEMEARSGDPLTAARTLERSLQVDPNSAEGWGRLGEMRSVIAEGKVTPEARQALDRALALDPKAVVPRYLVGRSEIDAGRRAEGLAIWRAMLPELGPEERAAIEREIAEEEGAATLAGRPVDPAIQGMVARLAERLKQNPDDPAGWARLVRSYRVLGDEAALQAALTEARTRFRDRPSDLSAIEAAVNAAPQ
jgi:cytochrome c-type biogenesis protein CcmH